MKIIKGDPNPKAEVKTFYELTDLTPNFDNLFSTKQQEKKYEWTLFKSINNQWKQIVGNIKYGEKVSYIFGEKVVKIPFKIEVHELTKNTASQTVRTLVANITVIPKTGKEPQIGRVILLNRNNSNVNEAKFNEVLSAEARTSNLVGREITFYLWEEGASEKDKYKKPKKARVDRNGIAKIQFNLSEYASSGTIMSFFTGDSGASKKFFVSAVYETEVGSNRVGVTVSKEDEPKSKPKEESNIAIAGIEKLTEIVLKGVVAAAEYITSDTTNTAIRQAAKESFGENLSKLDLQAKGYQINGTPHGRPFEQGIDVVAKDPKSGMDILDETKFKSGNGKPYTNSKPTSSGRQGSTKWFKDRLNGRVSDVDAARISDKLDINSSQLQKTISKVEPNGNITRYQLNANGTTGNPVNVGTANVIKGNSKAANFINNVGRTVQANKGVASANQWLTRNAHTISRVGKVAGRGAVVVGIIFEGYNVYTAYQEEGEVGDKTKEAIGSASGALAGGLIGAKIGASVGVVVGGLVGGAIGAFAGSEFGKAIGNGRLKKEIASWF